MAQVRWQGQSFAAKPIKQLPNGNWLMEAQEHGARFTIGTQIEVKAAEVESMDAAAPDAAVSAAQLETAMAEERKALPSFRELMLKAAAKPKPQGKS